MFIFKASGRDLFPSVSAVLAIAGDSDPALHNKEEVRKTLGALAQYVEHQTWDRENGCRFSGALKRDVADAKAAWEIRYLLHMSNVVSSTSKKLALMTLAYGPQPVLLPAYATAIRSTCMYMNVLIDGLMQDAARDDKVADARVLPEKAALLSLCALANESIYRDHVGRNLRPPLRRCCRRRARASTPREKVRDPSGG